jgi:activator of HSP90 ATPase
MADSTPRATSNFDFDAYNNVMENANSGLRLYLAERMLQDVQQVMVRFRSPLIKDITDLVDEVTQLRADNKAVIAKSKNAGDTAAIDDPQPQPSNSGDTPAA